MADVITTLHPEGAPEDNLYPNIKCENIPVPVGFVYISTSSTSPASIFGGSWTSLGTHYLAKGKLPIMAGQSHNVTNVSTFFKSTDNIVISGTHDIGIYDNGRLATFSGSVSGVEAAVSISNYWSDNEDSSLNTVVYAFERVA